MKGLGLIAVLVIVVYLLVRPRTAGAATPPPGNDPGPSPAPDSTLASYGGADQLDNISQAISMHENVNPAYNNPGGLMRRTADMFAPGLATGSSGNGLAIFGDQGDGQDALNGYIAQQAAANPSWDFYDFFQHYLGQRIGGPTVTDQGNSDAYAEYVASFVGVDPTTPVSSVLGFGS